MATLITSQDFISSEIVSAKLAAADFVVYVSPEFEVDGIAYRVVLDGHHSLAASVAAGVDADVVEYSALDCDTVALLDGGDIDGFLEVAHLGADYRDAITGRYVW